MVRNALALAGLFFLAAGSAAATERLTLLDGPWLFQADPDAVGEAHGWEKPEADRSGWRRVTVPMASEASLERNKLYVVLPDSDAEREGDMRVVDESGEDYLYPADGSSRWRFPRPSVSPCSRLRSPREVARVGR